MLLVAQEMVGAPPHIHPFCFPFLVLSNVSKLFNPFADGAANY